MAYMHADKRSGLHQPIPKIQHKAMDNFGKKKRKKKKRKRNDVQKRKKKTTIPINTNSTKSPQVHSKVTLKLKRDSRDIRWVRKWACPKGVYDVLGDRLGDGDGFLSSFQCTLVISNIEMHRIPTSGNINQPGAKTEAS